MSDKLRKDPSLFMKNISNMKNHVFSLLTDSSIENKQHVYSLMPWFEEYIVYEYI